MKKAYQISSVVNVGTTVCGDCYRHVKIQACGVKRLNNCHIEAHKDGFGNLCPESGEMLLCKMKIWISKDMKSFTIDGLTTI